MARRPVVTVRGNASVRTEPDEALLTITLTTLRESPSEALAEVAQRSQALLAMLDGLPVDKADRLTTGVSVAEEFDHTPRGRRSLGHRATASVIVRMSDAEMIGRAISAAGTELGASIAGPQWYISPSNPAWLAAAREAAADARRKAQAYAEGVDARLGELVKLREPLGAASGGVYRSSAVAAAAAAVPMPIAAGELEASATVDATFALELE